MERAAGGRDAVRVGAEVEPWSALQPARRGGGVGRVGAAAAAAAGHGVQAMGGRRVPLLWQRCLQRGCDRPARAHAAPCHAQGAGAAARGALDARP